MSPIVAGFTWLLVFQCVGVVYLPIVISALSPAPRARHIPIVLREHPAGEPFLVPLAVPSIAGLPRWQP